MKKIGVLLMLLAILVPTFVAPITVKGKTLRELQAELDKAKQELEENETQKNLTQEQINSINMNINSIRTKISDMSDEMIELQKEIESLNEDIESKDKQIKEVMNFVQISNGESMYLEYAFGAQSFTDFIYRFAIAEQLANYNSKLIDEYNQMIKDNEQKKTDLETKTTELKNEQASLALELEKLDRDMINLEDSSVSIEDEIKAQQELIDFYKSKGCSLDQDVTTCGREILPATTAFYRPIISGYVTSEFGSRCIWLNGQYNCNGHSGIDFSITGGGASIYAVGTGMVSAIMYRQPCGGNMVFVHHRLKNGETYTSAYYHLRSVNVSVGDVVTKDSIIGVMGGNPSSEWWDSCSTGDHIHLTMAYGLYGTEYKGWSTFVSKTFNPRLLVNAPMTHYQWFNDRLTKY